MSGSIDGIDGTDGRIELAHYDAFAEKLLPAVQQAAAFARGLEGRVHNSPKPGESSAVKQALTPADVGTQEIILEALLEHFPEVCLAAEEDTETVAAFPQDAAARVVIDPIDGTLRSYLEASGPYAVIVGLVLRGLYHSALVSLPREGLYFDAVRGRGAYAGASGEARKPVRSAADGKCVYVSHGMPEAAAEVLRSHDYEVISACGGAVAVAPLVSGVCAGVRWADTPLGISIRGRVGVLIAREAGAVVGAANGAAFPEDMETPSSTLLVASHPDQLEHLNEALAAILP
jgi:fructose-1,6-bisphosphatase/inositol monophosphatase family enzyme